MQFPVITEGIDWALVVLYAFWLFFFGLVFRLLRENQREGFPLIDDITGRQQKRSPIWDPDPKTFVTRSGEVHHAPDFNEVEPPVNAKPAAPFPGAPIVPVGDPLVSGVGPASYVLRADHVDVTAEGENKLVPMKLLPEYEVADDDADPRGMEVVGADGLTAGLVEDLWIDRAEMLVRYLEVRLAPEIAALTNTDKAAPPGVEVEAAAVAVDERTGDAAVAVVAEPAEVTRQTVDLVLLPMMSATLSPTYGQVTTQTILARQFAGVPRTKSPDEVTLLEEDKIMAYYSAGELYATPGRSEPFL